MTVRKTITRVAAERGESLSALSLKMGRNIAYLQQYVSRGTPKRLPEEERRNLAIALNIDERELGARDPWRPAL